MLTTYPRKASPFPTHHILKQKPRRYVFSKSVLIENKRILFGVRIINKTYFVEVIGVDSDLSQWKKRHERYIHEIKEKIEELKQSRDQHVYSYFTYSIHFSHDPAHESMLLGSFHIQNKGREPFKAPYICLKLSENSIFHFSGKYLYKDSLKKMRMSGAWERLNEVTDKEEFWLRPVEVKQIEPGDSLTFSNFQLKWSPEKNYAGSLMGFTYGEEHEEGVPALNQINLSGMNVDREDDNHG
ncbi:hypothetical protein BN982_02220 [Halobacillus karajensis]|uniref:Uncharacterized protein n=1 Tax=Halobacillus karajensis TaxID=195088 RepID=A0A024P2U2_9BACI|nr:hypothetical protein BN982_02220 [Halobacillus karajensis]CDQ22373.1 hypothetical protein BN983_00581 [Halobacillus karajensis]CDQ28216.1 hypothetical protein BN981_02510 [Halobacillus karajensis]